MAEMTYQQAAQWAMDCQDACNLSGVVHSFDRAVTAIWAEANKQGKGTDWVNTHPIVALYLSKLVDLNGREQDYGIIYDECKAIAAQPVAQVESRDVKTALQAMLSPAYKALLAIPDVSEPGTETYNAYTRLCRVHEFARHVLKTEVE